MTKLTDVCDIQYGYAFDSRCFSDDETHLPLIRIRDVKRGYSETFYNGDYPEEYIIHTGDLLVGMDGEFNIARWKSRDALLNQRVCKIVEKKGINGEYIRFFLSKALKEIENRTAFVTVKHLSAKELNKIELDIPSIEKQAKIAESLCKIEKIITHRRTQLEKLDLLIKARFVEMFGDCEKNIRLGDCCEVHARIGWQALTRDEHMQTGEYMLVTGTDFINGRVNYDTCVYVAKERFDMDPHIILKENDVLITKDGSIGKVAVVHNLPKPATLNGGIFVVRPDDKFNKEYISYVFKGPLFERFVDLSKTGATIKHLNQKHLVEFTIPLPSIEKQNLFAVFSNQINKSKVAVQKALDEAQLLFDSLMQEYFG